MHIVDIAATGSYDESIESPSDIVLRFVVDGFDDRWAFG